MLTLFSGAPGHKLGTALETHIVVSIGLLPEQGHGREGAGRGWGMAVAFRRGASDAPDLAAATLPPRRLAPVVECDLARAVGPCSIAGVTSSHWPKVRGLNLESGQASQRSILSNTWLHPMSTVDHTHDLGSFSGCIGSPHRQATFQPDRSSS